MSGKNLNHLETQYPLMKAIIDGHNHDDEIDSKALADSTFFSVTNMGSGSGFDADMIDGLHVADLIANVLPVGSIIWFKGTDAQLPPGWKIMNGQTGTSDLRDLFVIGAGGSYDAGDTQGAFSTPISGSVSVGLHTLTGDEMPLHTHGYVDRSDNLSSTISGASTPAGVGGETSTNRTTASAGGGQGHGHPGSSIVLNNLNCVPPWYALYLIKKVN